MPILEGKFVKSVYYNDYDGFSVFKISNKYPCIYKDKDNEITCKGNVSSLLPGTPVHLEGDWESDKNGTFFKCIDVTIYTEDTDIISNYIHSMCPGFGTKTSDLIAMTFKGDFFSVIKNPNGADLIHTRIPKISIKRASSMIANLNIRNNRQESFNFATKYGISFPSAIKLSKAFGNLLEDTLLSNPYVIGRKFDMPFDEIDNIAYLNKKNYLAADRIEAIIYEALKKSAEQGNTYMRISDLLKTVNELSLKSKYEKLIPKLLILTTICNSNLFVYDEKYSDKIFLSKYRDYEIIIANELKRLCSNSSNDLMFVDKYIDELEKENGIKLEVQQRNSLNSLKHPGVKIIMGGPGTGKTTTMNILLKFFKKMYPGSKYALCSPTGRASQRMSEVTKETALTIHKTIDYKPFDNNTFSCKDYNNPIDAKLILVDEMSMVDEELFALLLKAIKNESIVILLGDVDQLPSVGPGQVLKDLIESQCIETYMLDVSKRQIKGNIINENIIKIKNGNTNLETSDNFITERYSSNEQMSDRITELGVKYFNSDNKYETQILSSTKRYSSGTFNLNEKMQEAVNSSNISFNYGSSTFKLHDKIIMMHNRPEYNYFNGDIGEIIAIEDTSFTVAINNEILVLDRANAEDMMLSYAITTHKSQGSEYPIGIIALPMKPYVLLKRKVLYTAVSRFKSKVFIISENNALELAIKNNSDDLRQTCLKDEIIKTFKGN